ncbi:MAG: thioether cross-link-forming SCIFF peptide maturase [Firmicutes bacterium]|nr:thioether cross-link-forming SCIFF peptide maturase [Bacillota bacterium]
MLQIEGYDFNSGIHKFQFNDYRILLDVNSGSVHLIDEITWDLLDALEQTRGNWLQARQALEKKYSVGEIEEVGAELQQLKNERVLFSFDDVPERINHDEPVVKSLCLNVAHDCNLRCAYCFGTTGNFGGPRGLMPLEVGQAAVDFLIAHSKARRHCEIDFFGGEPLLNMAVVKEIIAYARQRGRETNKEFRFTLTTNGTLLNSENQQYLNDEQVSVVLSLDGRKAVHDRLRVKANGSGTYQELLPLLLEFVASRGYQNYYIRGTYTRYNLDFAEDVKHLVGLGFDQISLEPVVAPAGTNYGLRLDDLPRLFAEYTELTRYYEETRKQGRPFTFFHFNLDLERGPCLPKRLSGCGAGHEYLAITPTGDIYPCHQFIGREGYKMGNLLEGGLVRTDLVAIFRGADIYRKPACRQCWARFYCSGGCHANAVAFNDNIFTPYQLGCALTKKRLECAIYLQVLHRLV